MNEIRVYKLWVSNVNVLSRRVTKPCTQVKVGFKTIKWQGSLVAHRTSTSYSFIIILEHTGYFHTKAITFTLRYFQTTFPTYKQYIPTLTRSNVGILQSVSVILFDCGQTIMHLKIWCQSSILFQRSLLFSLSNNFIYTYFTLIRWVRHTFWKINSC